MSEEVGELFPEVADWVDTEHTKRRQETGRRAARHLGAPGGEHRTLWRRGRMGQRPRGRRKRWAAAKRGWRRGL